MAKNIDIQVSKVLQEVANLVKNKLKKATGKDIGFVIICAPWQENSYANYVANIDREDAKELIKTLMLHWELGNSDIPFHKKN